MKKYILLSLLFVLSIFVFCHSSDQQETKKEEAKAYVAPNPEGPVIFFENFNTDPLANNRWVLSTKSKYTGLIKWEGPVEVKGIPDDKGLLFSEKAKHFAISSKIDPPIDNENKDLIIQYEVKFNRELDCGGAYIKLLEHNEKFSLTDFDNETPYIIMFGPDKCGANNKVHFIFRHYNPKSDKWEEKHLENPPSIKNDQLTHLYTLIVRKDNSFEIKIDNETVKTGNLLQDFKPSVIPPKMIDDPNDKKPADWVDEEYIDDPDAKKPDDWDETQPMEIDDPDDKKPEGWLDDEPTTIPDPKAKKPEDWDDEEDGVWEAPMIPNPKCEEVGCGEWKPRKIKNPAYKGKWKPPKIKNPAYKGEWKPKQIPNPHFFEDLHPHNFPKMGAIGIEIWTMTENIQFDNFLITHDEQVANNYAKATWEVKHKKEEVIAPKPHIEHEMDWKNKIVEYVTEYPIPIFGTLVAILVTIPLLCWACCGTSKEDVVEIKPTEEEETSEEKSEEKSEETSEEKSEEKSEETSEEKKEETPKEEKEETPKEEEKKPQIKKRKKKSKSQREE